MWAALFAGTQSFCIHFQKTSSKQGSTIRMAKLIILTIISNNAEISLKIENNPIVKCYMTLLTTINMHERRTGKQKH